MKTFKAHTGAITAACVSSDQDRLCTVSQSDRQLKIFDVANFDLIQSIDLEFEPGCGISFVFSPISYKIAISESKSGKIHLFKEGDSLPIKSNEKHDSPIKLIISGSKFSISIDNQSMLEFWDSDFEFPKSLKFELMSDTDFFNLCDDKILAMSMSPDEQTLTTMSNT